MSNQQNLKRLLPRSNTPNFTAGSSKDAATKGKDKASAFLDAFDSDVDVAMFDLASSINNPTEMMTVPTNSSGIWIDNENIWHMQYGMKPQRFNIILDNLPAISESKIVDDLLFNEYVCICDAFSSCHDDFTEFDFDVDQTLDENKGIVAGIGDDFIQAQGVMESWNENREEASKRLGAGKEWEAMASELLALQMQTGDAQEAAWGRAEEAEEQEKFSKEGKVAIATEEGGTWVPKGKKKPEKKKPEAKKRKEPRFVFGVDMQAPKSQQDIEIDEEWDRGMKWIEENRMSKYEDPTPKP